jgi:hypothetical protein
VKAALLLLLLLLLLIVAGCAHRPTSPELCTVGRDCPDAATHDVPAADLPSCDVAPPAFPPCTCGDYLCRRADGTTEVRNLCGPRAPECTPDAGIDGGGAS